MDFQEEINQIAQLSDSNETTVPINTTDLARSDAYQFPACSPGWWWRSSIVLPDDIYVPQVITSFRDFQGSNVIKPFLLYNRETRELRLYGPSQEAFQKIFVSHQCYWTWHLDRWQSVAAVDLFRAA